MKRPPIPEAKKTLHEIHSRGIRFHSGVYADCRWCQGRGCLSCPAEADKAYKRDFPDGPQPILTIKNEEFDALEISKATGGPGIKEAHGQLGVLAAKIFEIIKSQKRP